jgi:hypothetical protein
VPRVALARVTRGDTQTLAASVASPPLELASGTTREASEDGGGGAPPPLTALGSRRHPDDDRVDWRSSGARRWRSVGGLCDEGSQRAPPLPPFFFLFEADRALVPSGDHGGGGGGSVGSVAAEGGSVAVVAGSVAGAVGAWTAGGGC